MNASESFLADLAQRLRSGDRAALARAITLVESRRGDHRRVAQALIQTLAPGAARRCASASLAFPASANQR
jgi:putative protein kinase ArgK-like GTPase of G3E family